MTPLSSPIPLRGHAAGHLGGGPSRPVECHLEAVRMTVAHAPNPGRGSAVDRPAARTEVRS